MGRGSITAMETKAPTTSTTSPPAVGEELPVGIPPMTGHQLFFQEEDYYVPRTNPPQHSSSCATATKPSLRKIHSSSPERPCEYQRSSRLFASTISASFLSTISDEKTRPSKGKMLQR